MHSFRYRKSRLHCEGVSLEALARRFGTPLYVYSQETFAGHLRDLDNAMAGVDHLICFAVKSNSNLALLREVASLGGGFDVVSQGELARAMAAGGDPAACVFAGVGKTEEEIRHALGLGIYSFNVESWPELERINLVAAKMRKKAPVAMRVNPNVAAGTHKKITTGTYDNKFGIAFEEIPAIYDKAGKLKNLRLQGLQFHIGSQITEVKPFEAALKKVAPLILELKRSHNIEFFSMGGGLGIVYENALASGDAGWWTGPTASKTITPALYAKRLLPLLKPLGVRVLLEPGRFISGNAGVLVTKVEYVKTTGQKTFVIVDGAMNDLIRPAFYDAYHEIVPLNRRSGDKVSTDVVGPICESGDFFCQNRPLPRVKAGDYLALMSAGAYGSVMSSNYNSRPLPAEVLVRGKEAALVRKRQTLDEIWTNEHLAPWQSQVGARKARPRRTK